MAIEAVTRTALSILAVLLSSVALMADDVVLDGLDGSNVYQRIKDADQNGFSVRRFTSETAAAVDVILDEQGVATGGRGNDAAARPLFRQVDESKLTQGVYPEFIDLLDNYVVRATEQESYSVAEQQEIDTFLDKVIQTKPMRVAIAYIGNNLGHELTEAQFRQKLETIWFELFENHFGNRDVPFCSGFEHVFIGEGQFPDMGKPPRRGEVSGYHNWVRFYMQEKAGQVNYLGHKYDLPASRKPANPGVVTLRMIWNYDPDGPGGEQPVELFKPRGGFFVGTSPECEIAMGTVAYFEQEEGLFSDDKRRTAIDGATYDLVLYRSVNQNGSRGELIRSFYPVLVGLAQPIDDPATPPADSPVVIVRAMPNPEGDDETGEWVEVKNSSEVTVELDGWELRDRQGGKRLLAGALEAGQVKRFGVPRSSHTMRMGNSGGKIRLFNQQELVHEVDYSGAKSGEIVQFN